jgi:hypothetical protein
MSLSRKPDSLTAQSHVAGATQTRRPPPAPPVYRPQPMPRVLQTKTNNARTISAQPAIARKPVAPILSRPQSAPTVSRARPHAGQRQPAAERSQGNGATVASRIIQRTPARVFKSTVVQATKFYPNLHPGAAVPVDRSNIFTLNNFADQYRLQRVNSHGVNVPNMKYNFVRTREGTTLLHNRYRHPSLAEGQQVLYAGEVFFNNGKLQWWSNGSGHYQPDEDNAQQANLPMDCFYGYQQIIKGEHLRKKAG